ncbi:MAG: hypothetical protein KAJ42_11710 [Gemmatimonadetes bacterium]|nr:hypothetical protein [Gemmatimonadota bacterium]
MTVERPARLKLPSPDARVARSPFRGRTGTGLDFWDTPTHQANNALQFFTNPLAGETFTIGTKTYTMTSPLGAADGDILIGATREASIVNATAAINLGAGSGSLYAAATTLHPIVFATPGNVGEQMFVIAKLRGSQFNSSGSNPIQTIETLTDGAFGAGFLSFGTDGVEAFVPIVQWSGIRIRVKITGQFGEIRTQFVRPARNVAPLGEPFPAEDPQADDKAFFYTVAQPSIDETFLSDGVEFLFDIPPSEHIGENWLKLNVSTENPAITVLDFCDISGVLLGLYH